MLLTVVYLLAKLTLLVCFCVFFWCFRAVISAIWPYCPAEHLFLRVILFVLLVSCNRLCSQIDENDDDDSKDSQRQTKPQITHYKPAVMVQHRRHPSLPLNLFHHHSASRPSSSWTSNTTK